MANEVEIVVTSKDKTRAGVASATKNVQGFGGALKGVSKIAAGFVAGELISGGARKIKDEFDNALRAASDLEQALGGTKAVFGEFNTTIESGAVNAADAVGLSEAAYRDATTSIGSQLKRMTEDVGFAAEQSDHLVNVGADLAATYGGETKDAVHALGRAFAGEADPAEKFGLNLRVGAVQAQAVKLGLGDVESGTGDYARALVSLIDEQVSATGAMGQFAREADTAAGATQRVNARIEDLNAIQGESIGWIKQATNGTREWWAETKVQASAIDTVGEAARLLFTGRLPDLDDAVRSSSAGQRKAAEQARALTSGLDDVRSEAKNARPSIVKLDEAGEKLREEFEEGRITTDDLTGSLDELRDKVKKLVNPVLDLRDAENDFEEAVDSAREAVEDNGKTLDKHTEKGRNNRKALDDVAESTWDLIDAAKASGKKQSEVTEIMKAGRRAFIRIARKMGLSRDRAKELATELGLIPKNTKPKVKLTHPGFFKKIDRIKQALRNVGSMSVRPGISADGLGFPSRAGSTTGLTPALAAAASRISGMGGQVSSGFRPGAITSTGNRSYHGKGRAIDIVPPSMDLFRRIKAAYPFATELIYTPAGAQQLWHGRSHVFTGGSIQRDHYNHIHLALRGGGISRGGKTLVGEEGPELVQLPSGSKVFPHGQSMGMMGTGVPGQVISLEINVTGGGSPVERAITEMIRNSVKVRGGDVQTVLGAR